MTDATEKAEAQRREDIAFGMQLRATLCKIEMVLDKFGHSQTVTNFPGPQEIEAAIDDYIKASREE